MLIATYNRPSELRSVLEAVRNSTHKVSAVVIVDASEPMIAKLVETMCLDFADLSVRYIRSERGSLCHQRNLGKKHLAQLDIDYVQVLDDDTRPAPDYIGILAMELDGNEKVVGVSGITHQNSQPPRGSIVRKTVFWLIGLESFTPGSVSRAGCGIAPATTSIQNTKWLFGCSMWRSSFHKTQDYLDQLPGSSLFEDTEYSLRASSSGTLRVVPSAVLHHSLSPIERPPLVLYSYRFSRNRWFVIQAMKGLDKYIWYFISVLSLAAWHLCRSLFARASNSRDELRRAGFATIRGAVDALRKVDPI